MALCSAARHGRRIVAAAITDGVVLATAKDFLKGSRSPSMIYPKSPGVLVCNKPGRIDVMSRSFCDKPSGGAPHSNNQPGGAPSPGQRNDTVPIVTPVSAVVPCGGSRICPCGCGPCCFLPFVYINPASDAKVLADFRKKELDITAVGYQQYQKRIMQNRTQICQDVTADNLKQWEAALLEEKKLLDAIGAEDLKIAETFGMIAIGLKHWESELNSKEAELAKEAEDIKSQKSSAKDQHKADVVFIVEGVAVKLSHVNLSNSQNNSLKAICLKQSGGNHGRDSHSSGTSGSGEEWWYDTYDRYQRRYTYFVIPLRFGIGCLCIYLASKQPKEDLPLQARAVMDSLYDKLLEKPSVFMDDIAVRVSVMKKLQEEQRAAKEKKEAAEEQGAAKDKAEAAEEQGAAKEKEAAAQGKQEKPE